MVDPETQEVIAEIPEGVPFLLCYEAHLEPGQHTSRFVVTKTSGEEVGFGWSFVLTSKQPTNRPRFAKVHNFATAFISEDGEVQDMTLPALHPDDASDVEDESLEQ